MTMKISQWLGCCATMVIAAVDGNAAMAQDISDVPAERSAQQDDTDVVPEPQNITIVVTAQKTEQNIQEAPVAITAIGGDSMVAQGITDIRAAQVFVPSVRFQQQNAATEIYIRGVGSTLDFPQVDPPSGFHLNSIYIPREGTSVPLYDIASLEVLPGPQGTLYGRGVLGGVVNVNFNRPTFEMETDVVAEVGNYSMFHTTFVQNVPISDTLAIRGAFDYNRHSGHMESGANSTDTWGARLSVLYEPTPGFSAYVWGAFVDKNGSPANLVARGVDADGNFVEGGYIQENPWNDLLPPTVLATSPFGQVDARGQNYDNRMFGAEFNLDLTDEISLTYIPSWLKFEVEVEYWLSGLPAYKRDEFEQTTHELRLSGDHDWGNWLVGLYGYRMTSNGEFFVGADFADLQTAGFPVSLVDRNRIKGLAGFAQLTYNVTDDLRLIAGGRYSLDDRFGRGRFFDGAGLSPFTSDENYDNFDFKFGVNYDVASDAMLYATIETGYQPGTYNTFASTPAVSNKVDAASLTAYTAGLKAQLIGGSLTWNNEIFYYDYRDLFASAFNTVLNTTQTFNAEKVEIYGLQSDLVAEITPDDVLSISVGYLHARNKDFTLPDGTANFDGLQLQYAPDWTVSASYHHDFVLSQGYLRARVSTRYESSFFADFSQTPGGRQGDYTKTDLSLTYFADSGRWSLGAWIKNLEDQEVIAATAGGSNFPFNSIGATSYLEAPRTYGVRGTLSF